MVNHIHLDLVGGLSGDMFISSMLDAFPQFKQGLGQVINDAGFPDLVELETLDHDDGTLTGTRFTVNAVEQEGHHQHQHRHYSDIRGRLQDANLNKVTRDNALEIFRLIAEVEAATKIQELKKLAATHPGILLKADNNGWQPVHEAARSGNTKVLEYLIENGVDINARTNFGKGGNAVWWSEEQNGLDHPSTKLLKKAGGVRIAPQAAV